MHEHHKYHHHLIGKKGTHLYQEAKKSDERLSKAIHKPSHVKKHYFGY